VSKPWEPCDECGQNKNATALMTLLLTLGCGAAKQRQRCYRRLCQECLDRLEVRKDVLVIYDNGRAAARTDGPRDDYDATSRERALRDLEDAPADLDL
jgi:hypothetical protein